ncbi:uncharacterized protein I303_104344 [Kwoniella dejecticola CBS 10117]|uniref:Protein transport protein sec16 n=1 Tax=Kwoniella dejecticola CBS 10117 TaxID=1296121 RepID=A0A1A6A5L3_9TREE|nr:uncharacterized protein I303_04681 [Kwoniella dejecticola CBS 10117]OBR85346.1 hypothetical protein I303_04681 [Kwoniella dejecticola CBS 10117]
MTDQDNSEGVKIGQPENRPQITNGDLFGNDLKTDTEDVFAQLETEGHDPFEGIAGTEETHELPTEQEERVFADATQLADVVPLQQEHPSPPPPDEIQAPPSDEQPTVQSAEIAVAEPAVDQPLEGADPGAQDFSDLLAEFEAETELEPKMPLISDDVPSPFFGQAGETLQIQETHEHRAAQNEVLDVPKAASALFEDDSADPFAELTQQDTTDTSSKPTSPSPVPSLSIEHSQADARPSGLGIDAAGDTSFNSMFSDASNWLGDTTVDESMQISPMEVGQKSDDDGQEPLDFEIPQGWYDDDGEWHWYTDEEKEQVKQTMLGQMSYGGEEEQVDEMRRSPSGKWTELRIAKRSILRKAELTFFIVDRSLRSFSPALQGGVSENAARRTPQPDTPSRFSSSSYDPYAPSTAQPSGTSTAYPMTSTTTYTSSAYEPYSGVPSNAPYSSTSSYNSHITAGQSTYDPYAPSVNRPLDGYTPAGQGNVNTPAGGIAPNPYGSASTARSALSVVAKPDPPRPQPPRMTSNAYDPPFLKPQKSFVRAASALPSTSSPSFAMPPSLTASTPPASSTPPPPPVGPARRAQHDARPSSRGPAFAAPPRAVEQSQSLSSAHNEHVSPYNLPPRPPSASQGQRLSDYEANPSPPKPLYRPSPSAFDPPLPQPSFRAPSRTASAASQHNYSSSPLPPSGPPRFAPAPKASESPYTAPRPLSRGPPSRQPSPMFAARPPSRPDVTQRMRSPPASTQSLNVEQLLSPPSMHDRLPEQQNRRSLDDVRPPGVHGHEGLLGTDRQISHDDYDVNFKRHISPPVLSRRYDEEGEDDGINEYPYTPIGENEEERRSDPGQPHHTADGVLSHTSPYGQSTHPIRNVPSNDPYAPAESLGLSTQHSPQDRHPRSDMHGLSAYAHENVVDLNDEAYGSRNGASNDPPDPYAPSKSDISPQKVQAYPHRSQPSRGSTKSYEPSIYSPPTSTMPLSIPPPSNPYAPGPAQTASPAYSSGYGMSPPTNNYFQPMHASSQSTDDTYIPQQVLEQRPVSEDPLGRTTLAARNTPIAVFGFGGTLITAFPGAAESGDFHRGHSRVPSYGYASGRGQLWIRSISEVAAPAALKNDSAFPGPLVFDPSTPKGAAGDKKKREAVLTYLGSRAEEIAKGLPYLKSSANKARREEEGRLVLIKILRALVIGDGNLAGSPEVADALRDAFSRPSSSPISTTAPVASFGSNNFGSSLYPPVAPSSASPVAARAAQLTRISSLLARGDKQDAALYAADNGLWSHALIISSNAGVDLWREIVGRFVVAEIGQQPEGTAGIKASYLLSAGINGTTVDELVKAATISEDPTNDQWREVIGSVLFNAKQGEHACLDELGAKFLTLGLRNAAHACFLLSPLSPFFDLTPAAHDKTINLTANVKDEEAVIFAEIAEYARSLVPTAKGQEAHFAALPQLLPYKLARAWRLAELGETDLAQRYCAAIESGSKFNKNLPSLISPAYAASLEDLLERLTGSPSIDPPNALGSGRKNTKPAIDKIGSWFERGLTKFIAGEEGDGSAPKPATQGKAAGPFAQFSAISNGSNAPSRNTSVADFNNNGHLGVSRTTSPASSMTPQWGHPSTVPAHGHPSSSSSSQYGDQYNQHDTYGRGDAGGYSPWTGGDEQNMEPSNSYGQDQDHGYSAQGGDASEFINPMAQLNLGPSAPAPACYEPQPELRGKSQGRPAFEEDDEDDLGFGNAALSRDRTPKPPSGDDNGKGKGKATAKDDKPEAAKKNDPAPPKPEHKSSWLGRIWGGKKEGEQPTGPVKANLGEESSMIFDPELKRWVVKGAKPEAAGPSAPPPPPRAQTASPSRSARPDAGNGNVNSNRAMSATPPPGHRPPPPSMSSINGAGAHPPPPMPMGFAQSADGSIKRMKSSLHESVSAADLPSGPPASSSGGSAPPRPPLPGSGSGPPSRTSSSGGGPPSIDDLLSRPPSKRPASAAAKKGARNRYVDVFQQPEGQ